MDEREEAHPHQPTLSAKLVVVILLILVIVELVFVVVVAGDVARFGGDRILRGRERRLGLTRARGQRLLLGGRDLVVPVVVVVVFLVIVELGLGEEEGGVSKLPQAGPRAPQLARSWGRMDSGLL